jgi:hypothetical protein
MILRLWGPSDGSLKICEKKDPNKILPASEGGESGQLHRVPPSKPKEFIEFYDHGTVPKVDLISEYESPDKCLFFCAESGTRVRIEFPRYKDANGNPLSIKKSGDEWVLRSSPNLKLVQTPQLRIGNNERINPLIGYESAIWMENISNPGMFKCLLPSASFTRIKEDKSKAKDGNKPADGDKPADGNKPADENKPAGGNEPIGITHELVPVANDASQERAFFGRALVGEASFKINDLDFLTPQISS